MCCELFEMAGTTKAELANGRIGISVNAAQGRCYNCIGETYLIHAIHLEPVSWNPICMHMPMARLVVWLRLVNN